MLIFNTLKIQEVGRPSLVQSPSPPPPPPPNNNSSNNILTEQPRLDPDAAFRLQPQQQQQQPRGSNASSQGARFSFPDDEERGSMVDMKGKKKAKGSYATSKDGKKRKEKKLFVNRTQWGGRKEGRKEGHCYSQPKS